MRLIHLADPDHRDSFVQFVGVAAPPPPSRVAHGQPVTFRRYLAAADSGTHEALQRAHGDDYAQALIDGDPELDLEAIGRPIASTQAVYLSPDGEVLRVAPKIIEVLFGPDGAERERRDPVDTPSNIQDPTPVRWTKVRIKRKDAIRRFAFGRTLQLVHVDGLTYDYLHGLAKKLDEADELVLLGAGPTGRDPLVLNVNGVPWRGFLEGRVDGRRYQLLLRLSNLELKLPEARESKEARP
jgi:hypothetical protein